MQLKKALTPWWSYSPLLHYTGYVCIFQIEGDTSWFKSVRKYWYGNQFIQLEMQRRITNHEKRRDAMVCKLLRSVKTFTNNPFYTKLRYITIFEFMYIVHIFCGFQYRKKVARKLVFLQKALMCMYPRIYKEG